MTASSSGRLARTRPIAFWLCAALALGAGQACGDRDRPPAPSPAPSPLPEPSPPAEPDRLLDGVRTLVAEQQLTQRPLACLEFVSAGDPTPGIRRIDVRERHDADCGGDPATAPRLFSVEIDLATGAVASDARSAIAEMEPIPGARITP